MIPDETPMTGLAVRKKLGQLREVETIHYYTLLRAVKVHGLPSHPNPFGRGLIFYWSEIQAWLQNPQPEVSTPAPVQALPLRRPAGRPRKAVCQ